MLGKVAKANKAVFRIDASPRVLAVAGSALLMLPNCAFRQPPIARRPARVGFT
jgi:hypothetical protein